MLARYCRRKAARLPDALAADRGAHADHPAGAAGAAALHPVHEAGGRLTAGRQARARIAQSRSRPAPSLLLRLGFAQGVLRSLLRTPPASRIRCCPCRIGATPATSAPTNPPLPSPAHQGVEAVVHLRELGVVLVELAFSVRHGGLVGHQGHVPPKSRVGLMEARSGARNGAFDHERFSLLSGHNVLSSIELSNLQLCSIRTKGMASQRSPKVKPIPKTSSSYKAMAASYKETSSFNSILSRSYKKCLHQSNFVCTVQRNICIQLDSLQTVQRNA